MKLSPNFALEEFTYSQTAARKGIDNTPPAHVIENLRRLAATLEEIRAAVRRPIIITSGYRCPELNREIGGSLSSAHLDGLAADIRVPGMTPISLARKISDSAIVFDQLILEFDQWVHIGLSEREPRRQCLTIRRGVGYRAGIIP